MNELKMTLNQIKNETIKTFDQGYDNPEDFNDCTNQASQEFHCCGDDCPQCSGNNECRCSCSTTTENSSDNLESCVIERIWQMDEHIPPQNINDEVGTNVHYMKVIRITKNYRQK